MAISDLLKKLTQDDDLDDELQDETSEDDSFVDEPLFPEDDLEPDPKPQRMMDALNKEKDKFIKQRAVPKKLTKAQKTKAVDNVEILVKAPAMLMSLVGDSVCSSALSNNSAQIAESMIPIIERNASMIEWFTRDGGNFMDYFALTMAVGPVVHTIWHHHSPNGKLKHAHIDPEEENYVYQLPDDL